MLEMTTTASAGKCAINAGNHAISGVLMAAILTAYAVSIAATTLVSAVADGAAYAAKTLVSPVADGADGAASADGADGAASADGADGADGAASADGADGADGADEDWVIL